MCFPYAGGSPRTFACWPNLLPGTEVLVANLPGRGRRFTEEPTSDIGAIIREVTQRLGALGALGSEPLHVFGHSMGAYLAFELALHLELAGHEVTELVVSGASAPAVTPGDVARLEDDDVLDAIREMGVTPPQFFESPDLVSLFLPVLQADFHLAWSYWAPPTSTVSCPLQEIVGRQDPAAAQHQAGGWASRTRGAHRRSLVDGDHFFVDSHPRCTTALLTSDARQHSEKATG